MFVPFLSLLSSLDGVVGEGLQEASVNVRAQEPRVRVSLHQAVDDLLSVVEAAQRGSLHTSLDLLSSVVVDVDLEQGLGTDVNVALTVQVVRAKHTGTFIEWMSNCVRHRWKTLSSSSPLWEIPP